MPTTPSGHDTTPSWQGLNHLALITNDMDATVRFWHGVLGAPLVATIGTDTFRHYFFSFGPTSSVAFFEYIGQRTNELTKPAGVFDARAGQFDHLSMDLPDEDALLALRRRLVDAGSEVTDVVDHGLMRSIYFNDPNGIALEASWWADDPTATDPDFVDERYFRDPDPVSAVLELREGGLRTLPATTLVDEPTPA
ncbi:MAG: VOC family protein [Ilumatobacter sp.]|uniref:VOC family protein n=1 Tax=Ilumatobacter sp. TaxID=1967498 RepID=UPI002608CAC4|nr:VOC family protein [Ilumatobacter sp.]MDJ0769586.1 VOC family protein [Ilumatobacter sp.]